MYRAKSAIHKTIQTNKQTHVTDLQRGTHTPRVRNRDKQTESEREIDKNKNKINEY